MVLPFLPRVHLPVPLICLGGCSLLEREEVNLFSSGLNVETG